jgi:pilus assembly protein Flp/PilA
MKNIVLSFVRDDQGQDLIEYGLLIGLITVGVIAFIGTIGTWVATQFSTLNAALNG